jgi:hypothetical protein
MDQELREYLDKRFEGIEERLERVETDTRQTRVVLEERLERVETDTRQTRVVLEERLERVETDTRQTRVVLEKRLERDTRQTRVVVEGLQGQIQLLAEGVLASNESRERFQEEVREEFKDLRASMHLPYPPLDRRVTRLEGRVKKLESARRPRKQSPTSRASSK